MPEDAVVDETKDVFGVERRITFTICHFSAGSLVLWA
jgi:hypothetical protein